ncbi:MAG: dUTP diphosphatase [Candidatus Phytoplasma pruni]|nr:dUTP diphosphatase [Candidatus Phytoplasma pruni]MDW3617580.1 dUTP diphosphatase [Candidatus Phytoplasma pruni]
MNNKKKCVFEVVSAFQNQQINLPQRQTNYSAGYDLEAAENMEIPSQQVVLVPTGVKASFPNHQVLLIYVRSSLPLKKGLMLANNVGVIDSDYYNNEKNEGHIFIPLYNFSDQTVIIEKHERIAQGLFQDFYVTDDDHAKTKKTRKSGFGSTNEKKLKKTNIINDKK